MRISAGKIPTSGIAGMHMLSFGSSCKTVVQSGHVRFLVALHFCQHLRDVCVCVVFCFFFSILAILVHMYW